MSKLIKKSDRNKLFGLSEECEIPDESFYAFKNFVETCELFCLNINNYKHLDIELGGEKYKTYLYERDYSGIDYRQFIGVKVYHVSAAIYKEGNKEETLYTRGKAKEYIDDIYDLWRKELKNLLNKYETLEGLSMSFKLRPYWEHDWFFQFQFPRSNDNFYYIENNKRFSLLNEHIRKYVNN